MAYGGEVEKLERRWMENPIGVSFAPLAEAYRRAGDQARALELLAVGLANHPAYVPALIVQARCHLDGQADGAAEESFLAVLATDGHNLIALKGLADICERSDRPELARKHLDRLLEADPTHDEGREQMDRLLAVLVERERMRGEAPATPSQDETSAATTDSIEAASFEPADAGSFDDPAALEEIPLSTETLGSMTEEVVQEEPAAESGLTDEDLPIEAAVAEVAEPEFFSGQESTEGHLQVEREVPPFETFDTDEGEARTPPSRPDAGSLAVPFEEELPAAWLEQSPAESMPDPVRDEPVVDSPFADEAGSSEVAGEDAPLVAEPDAVPDFRDSVWAPTGSLWVPNAANDPVEEDLSAEAEVPTEEAHWAGGQAADPVVEPESVLESPAPIEDSPWRWQPEAESMSGREAGPDDPHPAIEAPDIVEFTPETATWRPTDPEVAPAEEVVPSETGEPEPAPDTRTPEFDDVVEQEPALPAWGDATDLADALRAEAADNVEASWEADEAVIPTADDGMVVVEGAETELPSDPEPEIEPALIMTETMARLFERQGHKTMALAIYAQLAEQAPDNPDLAAAVGRLARDLTPTSTMPGTSPPSAGVVDTAAVDAILGRGGLPSAQATRSATDRDDPGLRLDGPATRASDDLFSLSAVFGTARPGPAAQTTAFGLGSEAGEQEPSFDEFFGSEETTSSGGARTDAASEEDLEQFTAWLRSLKR